MVRKLLVSRVEPQHIVTSVQTNLVHLLKYNSLYCRAAFMNAPVLPRNYFDVPTVLEAR